MDHPQLHWNLDAAALIAIAVWSAVYARRFVSARREAGGRGAGPRQLAAFTVAVVVVVVAVLSPLDRLGEEYLFSAHMVQHLLLSDIAPLLPRIWGLSAIEDQNVGGAIMMVEQSLVLVTVLAVLFARMLAQSEQDEQRRERLAESR